VQIGVLCSKCYPKAAETRLLCIIRTILIDPLQHPASVICRVCVACAPSQFSEIAEQANLAADSALFNNVPPGGPDFYYRQSPSANNVYKEEIGN